MESTPPTNYTLIEIKSINKNPDFYMNRGYFFLLNIPHFRKRLHGISLREL